MLKYSEFANSLNLLDVSSVSYSDENDSYIGEKAVFAFVGRKKLNGEIYYMISLISHYLSSYRLNVYSNYIANKDIAERLHTSRRAIDVTFDTFKELVSKGLVYGKDVLLNLREYPYCDEGMYDDNKLVVVAKVKSKAQVMILFATADGRLCAASQLDFIESFIKGKECLFGKKVESSSGSWYLRVNTNRICTLDYSDYYTFSQEVSFLSFCWYNGCMALGIGDKYKGLKEVDECITYLEDNTSDRNAYMHLLSGLRFNLFAEDYDVYVLPPAINRWNKFVKEFGHYYTPVTQALQYELWAQDLVYKRILTDGTPSIIYLAAFNLSIEEDVEHGSWLDLHKNSPYSINVGVQSYFKDGYLCIRAALPAVYDSDCVKLTVKINLADLSLSHDDVRIYTKESKHWIAYTSDVTIFGKSYYDLTGSDKYLEDVDITLSKEDDRSYIENQNSGNANKLDSALNIGTLAAKLAALGYKQKKRNVYPDFVFMNINKSAWLNEREFVTLRQYSTSTNKEIYQMDLYQDGKYHSTISGDFGENALEVLVKEQKTSNLQCVLRKVPKVIAEQYAKSRNAIYYYSDDFFMEYASIYNTDRSTRTRTGKVCQQVAKFIPTGEFCIVSNTRVNKRLSADLAENVSQCYILVRFKTEEEAFSAFTEIYRKRNVEAEKDSLEIKTALKVYFGNLGMAISRNNYLELQDIVKNIKEQGLTERCLLKYTGLSNENWRDIFYMVSDKVFETMIFD